VGENRCETLTMRILILTQAVDTKHPVLSFFHRWIEEFAKHCESVIVICLYKGKHHLPKNVRVLSLGKEKGVSRLKYLKRFYKYIWKERRNYDSVFVHMNQIYVLLGGLLWRLLGKRVALWYAHGSIPFSLLLSIPLSHLVFTSTKYGFRFKTRKLMIVGQGIDIDQFPYVERDSDVISRFMTVGRISPVKNLEILIDTVALLHSRDVSCTLDIIGDAQGASGREYKLQLIERIRGRDIENAVTWHGAYPHVDIPRVISEHDLFLHASKTGSLDKTVLEAFAVGTIPVTCDPTLSEELPEEIRSLCIAKHDNLDSYVRAVMNIRSLSGIELERLRKMGRRYVEDNHSIESLITKILYRFIF